MHCGWLDANGEFLVKKANTQVVGAGRLSAAHVSAELFERWTNAVMPE